MSKYDDLIIGFGQGSGIGTGKLYNVKPLDLTEEGETFEGDFDVDRNSIKNVEGKDGELVQVGLNVPSMAYLNGDTCPVLFTEPSVTNFLHYSIDFSNSYWLEGGLTKVSGVVSPEGIANAFELTTATSGYMASDSVSLTEDETYSCSVWLKGSGSIVIRFQEDGGDFTSYANKTIELTSEWVKYSVTGLKAIDGNPARFVVDSVDSTDTVYTYSAQMQNSLSIASDVLTVGSTATSDNDKITGAESTFESAQGVLILRTAFIREYNDSQTRMLNLSDGSSTYRIELIAPIGSDDTVSFYIENDGDTSSHAFDIDNTQDNEYILKWGQDIVSFRINGIEVLTNAAFNTFPLNQLTTLNLANRLGSGNYLYGKTKYIEGYNDIQYYNKDFTTFNEMATFAKYNLV